MCIRDSGSPASAAAPAPATAPVAAPIPAWLPAAIATVHFEAVAPPEDEAHGKQEPGEPEPVLRARLTAELPALGSIAIDVRLDSGAVRVSLAAADESGPVLRSGAAELAQALGARGLVLARHEVTHG